MDAFIYFNHIYQIILLDFITYFIFFLRAVLQRPHCFDYFPYYYSDSDIVPFADILKTIDLLIENLSLS